MLIRLMRGQAHELKLTNQEVFKHWRIASTEMELQVCRLKYNQ